MSIRTQDVYNSQRLSSPSTPYSELTNAQFVGAVTVHLCSFCCIFMCIKPKAFWGIVNKLIK